MLRTAFRGEASFITEQDGWFSTSVNTSHKWDTNTTARCAGTQVEEDNKKKDQRNGRPTPKIDNIIRYKESQLALAVCKMRLQKRREMNFIRMLESSSRTFSVPSVPSVSLPHRPLRPVTVPMDSPNSPTHHSKVRSTNQALLYRAIRVAQLIARSHFLWAWSETVPYYDCWVRGW